MKKLLLVINEDRFFLSHRTQIAVNAAAHGWDVTIVTKDTGRRKDIEAMGFKYIELPINPTGMNPREELKTLLFLYRLYRKNPDAIIHHVGLKNMLWGGIASRLTKTKGALYAVSGLGTLFGEGHNPKLAWILLRILGIGMSKKNVTVIFQNHDDEKKFLDAGVVRKKDIVFIKGSGVKLDEYTFTPQEKKKGVKIIFTGRMLEEKGVKDLIEAAKILRPRYEGKAEFILCGGLSNNPNAISADDMHRLTDGGYIRWLGHRNDICCQLKEASIMCFPSFYREGVPKSLIEASAIGLPIVTTDSVGCRDTVEEGKNGFIVPTHRPDLIAEALSKLIDDPELRRKMGIRSRELAERDFNVDEVADTHLKIYEKLNQ